MVYNPYVSILLNKALCLSEVTMFNTGGRFARFMQGRCGLDFFGYMLSWIYLILLIVQIIVGLFSRTASVIMSVIIWVLFFFMLFRIFSKNLAARSKENRWAIGFFGKLPFLRGRTNNFGNPGYYSAYEDKTASYTKPKKQKLPRDKYHVYRKCRSCGAKLRLPKVKGRHSVRCPACNTLFDVWI